MNPDKGRGGSGICAGNTGCDAGIQTGGNTLPSHSYTLYLAESPHLPG